MNRSPTFWLFLGVLWTVVTIIFILEKRPALVCVLYACFSTGCYITSFLLHRKDTPPKAK